MGAGHRDAERKAEKQGVDESPVMKWNDEIRQKDNPDHYFKIYDSGLARSLFNENGKELSLKKQENIRMAIKEKCHLSDIQAALDSKCGLCFAHEECDDCPAQAKILGVFVECCCLNRWGAMERADTLEAFAKIHKAWCQEIGLWLDHWE